VDDADCRDIVRELRARLEGWFRRHVDPRRDGVDKGVTGCGQLARVDDAHGRPPFAADHTESTDWDLWLEKKRA
jgi:hypothetical protein